MDQATRNARLRDVLELRDCRQPASVFDPVSARIAEFLDLRIGLLGGSVVSAQLLGAPDLALLTLTELVDLVRRTTQAADISLIVDGDHGYGNALNVMRTVRELEHAGASGIFLEETALPSPFRGGSGVNLISPDEMVGKLGAAIAARSNDSTVIVGRTDALRLPSGTEERLDETVKRVRAYAQTGIDAILLVGVTRVEEVEALRDAVELPLLVGAPLPEEIDDATLRRHGVSMSMRGHFPFSAVVRAIHDALAIHAQGLPAASMQDRLASPELMAVATGKSTFDQWTRDFLT